MQSRVRFESYLFASIIRPIIFVVSDHALNRFESEDIARYRRRHGIYGIGEVLCKDTICGVITDHGWMPKPKLAVTKNHLFQRCPKRSLHKVKIVNMS